MRLRLLALALAGLTLSTTGCRSHLHAGGGQGLDAGAAVGPIRTQYVAPEPPPATIPLPDPMPPR